MKNEDQLFELWRTFESFIDRSWTLLNDISVTSDTHSYLYAALDLRFAIEKLLSILLVAVSEKDLTKKQRSMYRVKDFVNEMKNENSEYLNLLQAKINRRISASGKPNAVVPDINKLNELYGKLGNLLHLGDSADDFIEDQVSLEAIEEIVIKCYEYLEQFRNVKFDEPIVRK